MATKHNRHICRSCGKKSIEPKMIFSEFWFHQHCFSNLIAFGTPSDECLTQLLKKIEKCPYYKLVSEKYSTPFWLGIREKAPLTFEYMILKEHSLSPSGSVAD